MLWLCLLQDYFPLVHPIKHKHLRLFINWCIKQRLSDRFLSRFALAELRNFNLDACFFDLGSRHLNRKILAVMFHLHGLFDQPVDQKRIINDTVKRFKV